MKKLAILIISIICFSCSEQTDFNQPVSDTKGNFEYRGGMWHSVGYKIEEKTIDSCQYIIIFGVQHSNIIHKANCNNHTNKK